MQSDQLIIMQSESIYFSINHFVAHNLLTNEEFEAFAKSHHRYKCYDW